MKVILWVYGCETMYYIPFPVESQKGSRAREINFSFQLCKNKKIPPTQTSSLMKSWHFISISNELHFWNGSVLFRNYTCFLNILICRLNQILIASDLFFALYNLIYESKFNFKHANLLLRTLTWWLGIHRYKNSLYVKQQDSGRQTH